MSQEKRRKMKEIVLKIGEKSKKIQGVTEYTTCGDVIKMVLCKPESVKECRQAYAIFESGSKFERLLDDKTKVLKTMRSWGSDSSYHFTLKAARSTGGIYKAKQERKTKADKLKNAISVGDSVEKAAKLARFVQCQKTSLQKRRRSNRVTEIYYNPADTSTEKFISNVDQANIAGFLNSCRTVTANEPVRLSGLTASHRREETGFVNGKEISRIDKINDVKYATKKVLKSKRVLTYGRSNLRMPAKHTFIDCDHKNVPTHSTPRHEITPNLKRHEELADDIARKIARLDQKQGKDIILQRYFADYMCYYSPRREPIPMPKRGRGDGAEAGGNPDKGDGSFSRGTPSLVRTSRNLYYSDSDSGQEDHDIEGNLDTAFICSTPINHRTSHLKVARIKTLSNRLVSYDETHIDRLVDYSLTDSSILESEESILDMAERNVFDEDEEMVSFMDSQVQEDFSDEGLSSLGSEDEKEIMV